MMNEMLSEEEVKKFNDSLRKVRAYIAQNANDDTKARLEKELEEPSLLDVLLTEDPDALSEKEVNKLFTKFEDHMLKLSDFCLEMIEQKPDSIIEIYCFTPGFAWEDNGFKELDEIHHGYDADHFDRIIKNNGCYCSCELHNLLTDWHRRF